MIAKLAGRSHKKGLVACLATAVGLSLAVASPAQAISKHSLTASFSGEGASALASVGGIAVDQATGDLYVTDPENHRVEKFDQTGEFVLMFGKEVDKTEVDQRKEELAHGEPVTVTEAAENVCTAASGDTCQPATSADEAHQPQPSQFTSPQFVAVDNSGGLSSGDVYVSDSGGKFGDTIFSKFDPDGQPISSWGSGGQFNLNPSYNLGWRQDWPPEAVGFETSGIAVASNGDFLFADPAGEGKGAVYRFGQFGSFATAFTAQSPLNIRTVAIGAGGIVLVGATDAKVHQISSTGGDLGLLTGAGFGGPAGPIAADQFRGQTYVVDRAGAIRDYGPSCEPTSSGCSPTDSFGEGLGNASGLAVDESSGVVYVADPAGHAVDIFSPAPFLPDVRPDPVSAPSKEGATLNGSVNPAGAGDVTSCEFQYVSGPAFAANDTNEVQTLTISGATGGTFALAYQGQSTGASASGSIDEFSPYIRIGGTTGTFVVGETISGSGIPPGTTITNVTQEFLTISHGASATATGVALTAGLANVASAQAIRAALAALPTIGSGNVAVSGAPGGPYSIEFSGILGRADQPLISADSSHLTPGGATATVTGFTDGGDGWGSATTVGCNPSSIDNSAEPSKVLSTLTGLTPETTYHYRLLVSNGEGSAVSRARTFTPHAVVGLTTEAPSAVSSSAATLHGSLVGDATPTHYHFEWGDTTAYGQVTPEPPAAIGSPSGPGSTALSEVISGLEPSRTYHYRIVAENGASEVSDGEDVSFTTPPAPPVVAAESVSGVGPDSALVHAKVDPALVDTIYHVEYGPEDCAASTCTSFPLSDLGAGNGEALVPVAVRIDGLSASTTYHYRVVAQSFAGTTAGADRTFTTLPFIALDKDPCANAHQRQQTSAAGLPDCRAYELVSAANAGGYDVESNLIPGQTPFAGYPEAEGRVLYGVQDGGIPGTNHPTNRGIDPYVATRGSDGWKTEYVGVPATDPFSAAPFSSTPTGVDAHLGTFAFGGPEGCSPCFEGGYTGIPVHLPDGHLTQGMVSDPGVAAPGPGATADGRVDKPLSANGEHLIFGSTTRFAPGGNDETGDVSIYDRNLTKGVTHVVSNAPGGGPLACLQGAGHCDSAEGDGDGIAELDVSHDGSRILIGQKVREDAEGKPYWHLYVNVNDSTDSVDLTPGTTSGVLFAGMTADGSRVFFTTKDQLLPGDGDHSGDLYEAEVSGSGATLALLSVGSEGTGNTDECDPAANSTRQHWNTIDPAEEDCGVVAIGGGGGVASEGGSIYFLSPEKLDGSTKGTQDAPNLYLVAPGEAPRYVTTLESALTGPQPPKLARKFEREVGSFTTATALAVDHSSGDLYVLDLGTEESPASIERFDSAGNPAAFSESAPYIEGNRITGTPGGPFGEIAELQAPTNLAIDQTTGDLYVPDLLNEAIDVFAPSGEFLSQIGGLAFPTGVAINPSDGNIYVSSFFGSVSILEPSGNPITQFPAGGFGTMSVAVDPAGTVYVVQFTGEANVYDGSGNFVETLDANGSRSVSVDPSNGDVYVDEGNQIARYDSSGNRLEAVGNTSLVGSVGVSVDPGGRLYATDQSDTSVASFSPFELPASPLTDSPTVIDAISQPATRHTADFQVSPSGDDAVFPAALSLTGYENGEAEEIFRYHAPADQIACVSCNPSNGEAAGDAALASDGLSLTDDGRVFFNTPDALVAGDTDNKKDVYEWEPQGAGDCRPGGPTFTPASGDCLGLISAGTSPFDSGLLGATRGGTDAYFFTRDKLTPQDSNGPTMKIYDAREGGGFPYLPPGVACRASDECHGPASAAPSGQNLSSESGTPHNHEKPVCKRGFRLRHGRCVKRHKHHRRRHHRHAGHSRGGGK